MPVGHTDFPRRKALRPYTNLAVMFIDRVVAYLYLLLLLPPLYGCCLLLMLMLLIAVVYGSQHRCSRMQRAGDGQTNVPRSTQEDPDPAIHWRFDT